MLWSHTGELGFSLSAIYARLLAHHTCMDRPQVMDDVEGSQLGHGVRFPGLRFTQYI